MKTDDISATDRITPVVPSRISVVLVEETKAGDTSRPECPCDDQERQPLAGLNGPRGGAVSEGAVRRAGGGGRCPLPVLPGGSFWLMLRRRQLCLLRDLGQFPRGFRWCWSMGPWLGTLQDRSVRVRMGFGDRGLARRGRLVCLWVVAMQDCCVLGRRCPPLMLPEGSGRWCPIVTGSPIGRVGRHVAGGPVGLDETLLGVDPLEHSGLDRADLAGQHAAVGLVGLFGTAVPI